jgi:hypothetical protein
LAWRLLVSYSGKKMLFLPALTGGLASAHIPQQGASVMSGNQIQQSVLAARGSPQAAPAKGSARPNTPFTNLGVPGLLSVLAGLLICGSFFLPWFTSSLVCTDPVCTPSVIKLSQYASSPAGFSIANGTFALNTTGQLGPIREEFSFLLLWLIFLAGLLLIVTPLLLALSKIHAGRTRVFLLLLGLLALVVEIAYGLSTAQALPQTRAGLAALLNGLAARSGRAAVFTFSTGPGLGFWLALAGTLVAVGAGAYALFAPSMGNRFDMALLWRNIGLSGQTTLVAGLALFVAFFLPWLSTPDPAAAGVGYQAAANKVITVAQTTTVSGWNTAANGLQTPFFVSGACTTCLTPHVSIFLSLWLVPIAALGLVEIAWLLGRGLLWRRMAAILACVTCLVALALEVFFLLEVQSLQSYDEQVFQSAGEQLKGVAYSVAWGFWVALAVSGVALLVSGFLLLQRHKSVTGMPAKP